MSGNLLQDKVFDTYVLEDNVTLPFYQPGPDGEPKRCLRRHRLNARQHNIVLKRYTDNIMKKGNMVGVRGLPWAIKDNAGGLSPLELRDTL